MASKTPVGRQIDRIEPKFGITSEMRNVNMRWFAILQTVEEEPVPINPEHYRHCFSLTPSQESATSFLEGESVHLTVTSVAP